MDYVKFVEVVGGKGYVVRDVSCFDDIVEEVMV